LKLATAVILSYNRQDSLRRQLLYYANKPVHLIFADGSDSDWGSGESGSIGEMTWEYLRIAGSDTYVGRLRTAVLKVETEYMFFLDDEECILWTGIESAIQFLSQNDGHSCASGRADSLSFVDGKLAVGPWGRWNEPLSLTQADAVERLSVILQGRTANLYYVLMRTRDARKLSQVFDARFSFNTHSLGFFEIYLASFLALAGKWTMGSYPFWFRYSAAEVHTHSINSSHLLIGEASEIQGLLETALSYESRSINEHSFEFSSNEISVLIEKYFGAMQLAENQFGNAEKTRRQIVYDLRNYLRSLLVRFHKVSLRVFFPGTYKLRPYGLMREKKFAKIHGKRSTLVADDILQMARLYRQYPHGVGRGVLEKELRLRANI
jgi:glycosyltransferase domain-containing protein